MITSLIEMLELQNFGYMYKSKVYSSLPNRRVARNNRGGGKDEPFLISVVPGISMVARIFTLVVVIKRRKKMN